VEGAISLPGGRVTVSHNAQVAGISEGRLTSSRPTVADSTQATSSHEWSGLIPNAEVVMPIGDDPLAFITALVPRYGFAGVGNRHFRHEALHPYLALSGSPCSDCSKPTVSSRI
jgi:hypothetical protein